MKKLMFAVTILTAMGAAAPAFADRWVAPVNGAVSAVAMPDGDVMMKIQMPAKEFKMMTAAGENCQIQNIYPGAADTMILVCHGK